MKILVVAGEGGNAGGEGRIALETALQLAKKSHDVTLFYPGYNAGIRRSKGITIYEYQGDGDYMPIPRQDPRLLRKFQKYLNEKDFDIVHFHTSYGLALMVQMWAIANKKPTVFTLHSLPSKTAELLPIPKVLSKTVGKAFFVNHFTRFIQNSNRVIALSPTMAHEVRDLDETTEVAIIPNGKDISKYKKLKICCKKSSENHFLYIGNLSHYKNQDFLLDVFRLLPKNYILHLAGKPIYEDYAEDLYKKVKDNKLTNVIFEGYIENDQTLPLLERSKAFVSPSLIENQSIVILEALASGTPVIGLENSTIEELVDDEVGYRFPLDTSPKKYAQKIMEIAKLKDSDYLKMAKKCREKVTNYSWDVVIPKIIREYHNAVDNNEVHQARIKPWDKDYLELNGFHGMKDIQPIVDDITDEVKRTGNKGYLYVAFALTFTAALIAGGVYAATKLGKKVKDKINENR